MLIRLDRGTEGIRAHNLWETITPGHVVHLIDHRQVLQTRIKAARSDREAATDENSWVESTSSFGEESSTLEASLSEGNSKGPRAGPGRHSLSVGALAVRMDPRLTDSLTGTVKGQPVPER